MSTKSNIEWTEATWNPTGGCEQVSPGCDNCYAKWFTENRLARNPRTGYFGMTSFADVREFPKQLTKPSEWRTPRRIFVNSMSDLFHRNISDDFIGRVFGEMEEVTRHTYMLLTKRPERMKRFLKARYGEAEVPGHIWVGVSVESNEYAWRRDMLVSIPAAVRWVSFEPLIAPVDAVAVDGIHWAVAGGESGSTDARRDMNLDWVRDLRDRCQSAGVPFFLKQLGGPTNHKTGGIKAVLDGRLWRDTPTGTMPVKPEKPSEPPKALKLKGAPKTISIIDALALLNAHGVEVSIRIHNA